MQEAGAEARLTVRSCNPYRRGRRFEYRTRNYLRKLGWFVIRQARSSFPDLIALRDGSILLVECKVNGYMPSAERRHIVSLARRQVRGKPILAFRKAHELVLSELSSKSARLDKPFNAQAERDRGDNQCPR